ncbi:MAG TPA: xanthine dehydrogenase family protein molybdopterin-binding subunit, partial [Gammaproteobacteria bacterium]|nr:xanthine dehydrogenase family protein molybdopterin-binding subunit [Gammaproteobacteria bacterium]
MSVVAEENSVKQSYKYVGTRPLRHDGLEKVNGKARFAADITKPRMIHGHVLRSPHAHAKILSIDTTEAEAMPGVKAVVTASDFPLQKKDEGFPHRSKNLIARDKVRYEGQAVAAVAATTRRHAREAAAKIIVNYQELPNVMTIDEAMAEDAPLVHENLITKGSDSKTTKPSNIAEIDFYERGDIDVGFAEADFVYEHEFTTEAFHQGYIEPHACLADTGKDGRSEIWCSSQGHFMVRSATANMLGWETSRIKVVPAEIGGGFGGKTTIYLEPLAVKLSEKADRPVKMVMSRDEVFKATGPTPGTKIRVKIGAKKNGEITAGKAWLAYQSGAFPGPWGKLGGWCIFACYNIPNVHIEAHEILLNRPVNIAYRAPSAPMAAYPTETVLDQIA